MAIASEVHGHSDLEVVNHGHLLPQSDSAAAAWGEGGYPNNGGYLNGGGAPVKMERRIAGLRTATFFLSLALVIVIIAAAVGGGVGGTMAVQNAKNSNKAVNSNPNGTTMIMTSTVYITSSTAIGTSTSASASASASGTASAAISVPTTGTLALDCPNLNGRTITVNLATTSNFAVTCGQDFGAAGIDILAIIAYSLHDCAQACASYNNNWKSNICKGAHFTTDLTNSVPVNYGTCWLKNSTTGSHINSENSSAGLILSS